MDRRQFCAASGAASLAAMTACSPRSPQATPAPLPPTKFKLGCQSGPTNAERLAFFQRYGIRNICAVIRSNDPARLYPTVDEIKRIQDMAAKRDISVDMTDSVLLQSSHIDTEKNPAIMLGQDPQRDRDIESFQILIRNAASAGVPCVKYNQSILGVPRNLSVIGRGDTVYRGWDLGTARADPPLTRAGRVDADLFWERITYFLERVVPVANEYRIRLACHPQDPGMPPGGYQGVDRVLGTVDGLKRFITIQESPYHGLNFCQGTISENLADPANEIFDVIRYFGTRDKIFNVHFRNIRGRRDHFTEVFPDEGDIDMVKAALTYREIGYDGMLMPDHVPLIAGKEGPEAYAYNLGGLTPPETGRDASFAFAYGHIRGILQTMEYIR